MKILLLFLLFLIPSISKSQIVQTPEIYSDWKLSNPGGNGIPSFYWRITRVPYGTQYLYSIWFYSNSVYPNGTQASVYVSGIYLYIDNIPINTDPFWVLFKTPPYSSPSMNFITGPAPDFRFTWSLSKIY